MSDVAAAGLGTSPIVLFLSTGRCGTQWLATNLGELYGGTVRVTHEPVGPEYRCREFFRAYERVDDMAAVPAIAQHLESVAATVAERPYIETGWPLFSAIPLFVQRFGRAVRIVHLTRHPVPTAISHMAHKTYGGSPRVDGYTQLAALDGMCPGVRHPTSPDEWEAYSPYERTLYWWTEVHQYADEIRRRYPEIAIHRVKAEDILGGDATALRALCDFVGLPFQAELASRTTQRVDQWHHRTDTEFDWRRILDHPETIATAQRLGYDFADVDDDALADRYTERAS